jgi:glucosyl-3-phosphoglycerate synthase
MISWFSRNALRCMPLNLIELNQGGRMKQQPSPIKPSLSARLLAWLRAPFVRNAASPKREPGAQSGSLFRLQSIPSPLLRVSVIIPALNEEKNIANVVRYALADAATSEVIVIDDSSIDDTAQRAAHAGARVVTSTMLGKGRSMRDGLQVAKEELLVYLDGDLSELRPGIIGDLARPLAAGSADFVKASFGRGGGRVTELTAKPMLKLFFPELAHFKQPLGGIIAARKSLMQSMHFEEGYGVDVGLLIDAHRAGARIDEVDIGSLKHESQSLQGLSGMAQEVGRVIFDRAKKVGRLTVEQILSVYELDQQNQADIDFSIHKIRKHDRVVLLPLEGFVSTENFETALAKATGRSDKLKAAMEEARGEPIATVNAIAQTFRFVHKTEFDEAAHALPIRDGVIALVNQLRRRGYAVGVVSERFIGLAEIMRRRVFADFAIAHGLHFESDVCQGSARINRAFGHDAGCNLHAHCMSNIVRYLRQGERDVPLQHIVALGHDASHHCMLEEVDFAFTLAPTQRALRNLRGVRALESLDEMLRLLDIATEEAKAA